MTYLIVRSAPMARYRAVLDTLDRDADITVITRSQSNAEIIDIRPVRLFSYQGTRLTVVSLGVRMLERLRKMRFDRVIVLCANTDGAGYAQIMFALLCMGVKQVELRCPDGRVYTVSPARFLKVWAVRLYYSVLRKPVPDRWRLGN